MKQIILASVLAQRKNELVSSPIPDYLCSGFPGVHFRCEVLYIRFRRLQERFYLTQLRGANSFSLPAQTFTCFVRREPACSWALQSTAIQTIVRKG